MKGVWHVVIVMFVTQGVDLRQYSREIESELRKVEVHSIHDCKSCDASCEDHVTLTLTHRHSSEQTDSQSSLPDPGM